MDTPAGDDAFLRELERNISTELATAEAGQPEATPGAPIGEQLIDPVAERYEVRLRSLLGAVGAVERGSHPGGGQ